MTKDEIDAKKQAINDKFNDLLKQKNDIDAELNRLQGEFRLLTELEDPAKEAKSGK